MKKSPAKKKKQKKTIATTPRIIKFISHSRENKRTHTLSPNLRLKPLSISRRSIQPLQNILPGPHRPPPSLALGLVQTAGQRLNDSIIIDGKEKRDTIPLLAGSIHDAMHGTLVQAICPAHEEIGHVDDEGAGEVGGNVPGARWFEDFEAGGGGREEEGEAFVVGVGA